MLAGCCPFPVDLGCGRMRSKSHFSGISRRIVFDTNILIDYFRGIDKCAEFLDSTYPKKRAISAITLLELCQGEYERGKKGRERIIDFLKDYRMIVLPITPRIYKVAEKLIRRYQQKGLDLTDAMIAATCIRTRYTLITRNIRHFKPIDNLRVEIPPYSGGI